MLKDILAQAWQALLFNRRRTAITMAGMAWGIATVVLLLAYGAGFSRAIENIFAQWGVHHMEVYAGRTSEQAGGDKFARGDDRVIFGGVIERRGFLAPGDELVGLAGHGRDHNGDFMPGFDLAFDMARDVADAVHIGDAGAAEFHDKA